MGLGKLSATVINKAQAVLKKIEDALKDETDDEDDDDDDDDIKNKDVTKKKSYKKVKLTGSVPIDEYCKYQQEDGWAVFEEGGIVWNATLNQTNSTTNANKHYIIQILENEGRYVIYNRWGRTGYKGQNNKGGELKSKSQCIAAFEDKFHKKSGNKWSNRDNFVEKNKKYVYLPMDYGANQNDDDDEDEEECKIESELDQDLQDLVKLIFDKKMFVKQLKEIGFDSDQLPLGKLSAKVINMAQAVLKKIEDALKDEIDGENDDNANKKKSKKKSARRYDSELIEKLSDKYYTYIPHKFGFKRAEPIDSEKRLKKEMKLIEALLDIEVATKMMSKDKKNKVEKHPCDKHFDLLKCDMTSLAVDDEEFKMCEKYAQDTHAETHNRYTLDVEKVFKLDRDESSERFQKWEKNENRMLLWHGSRLTNFVGIISQGLRIAPPEAPVTGYMFGKGVYFADMCSKSANYCFTSPSANTGLILLAEVALGDMNPKFQADYYADKLPKGKLSTKGIGG